MADFKQNYFQRRTKDRGPRSNNRISSPEVQVITSDGENFYDAAIRELEEETSIKSVSLIKKIDGLLTYHLPKELLGIIWKGKFKGQKQQWYIMRFKGDDKEINIRTKHPEFLEWKWVDPDKITELVVKFKLHVYEKIQEEVKKILVN